MLHSMNLQGEFYDFIQKGSKQYELRLNDEKRQRIAQGDFIEFHKEPLREDSFIVQVDDKLFYPGFHQLTDAFHIEELADANFSKERLLADLNTFYPMEEQQQYGAVAIKLNKNHLIYRGTLDNVNIETPLFNLLKNTYANFDDWFERLKKKEYLFFYTKNDKQELSSILLLKLNETDSQQFIKSGNIMKVRSIMVGETNKGIGTAYMKLVDGIALSNHIQYIYITCKKENEKFMQFLRKHEYRVDSEYNDELVLVKELA